MKWIKNNWISIVAIALSIVAVIRCEPFVLGESSLNWLIGICITIVGLGVATLLGTQIYNALTIDERIKERLELAKEELNKNIDESFQDTNKMIACTTLLNLGKTCSVNKEYPEAFENIILSIIQANKAGFDDFATFNTKALISFMKDLTVSKEFSLKLTKEEKEEYVKGVLGIKCDTLGELIDIIKSAKEDQNAH